ncbi:MAG TPA: PEP-CTERM sorting domain-containing protein [Tepidisphaeraceae bacterium]|jgi:hypothetical protein
MMKWVLLSIVTLLLAAPLKANTVFATFQQQIIYGTDTLEDPSGTVTGAVQYVAWGGEITPNIALDFQNDPTLLPGYPAATTAIQASASAAALTDDLTFLTEGAVDTNVVWADNGNAPVVGVSNVADQAEIAVALYPEDSLVSASPPLTLGQAVYSTGAIENPDTIIEGTVTFNIFELDFTARQTSVPEPSSLLSAGAGLLMIASRRLKNRSREFS